MALRVSHAQLLLRSVKDQDNESRIDVLFKAVESIDLPTTFTGLDLRQEGEGFLASGLGWSGWVRAAACYVAEDAGEYYEPSAFASSMPTL